MVQRHLSCDSNSVAKTKEVDDLVEWLYINIYILLNTDIFKDHDYNSTTTGNNNEKNEDIWMIQ